jgi:hypothetical protein
MRIFRLGVHLNETGGVLSRACKTGAQDTDQAVALRKLCKPRPNLI